MAIRLIQNDPSFEAQFQRFLTTKREASPDVEAIVSDIIKRVRGE